MRTAWKRAAAIVSLLLLVSVAPVRATTPTTVTPIQHVIVIVQENHAFDNYFGTYPTANGTLVTPITSELPGVNGIPNGLCLPYGNGCISPQLTNTTSPKNPIEGQLNYEQDYTGNATGFPTFSGPQSLDYFDYTSIPAYWDYAEEYGLADNYFAPFLAQSNPNRLAMLFGTSSVENDSGPPPYMPYNESIMYQLDKAGVSWGYYDYYPTDNGVTDLHFLKYIYGMTSTEESNIQNVSRLYDDLSSGTGLPAVSWVDQLGNKSYDEHPPNDPTLGEEWVVSVVNDVMKSSYWSDTAIFITWDEGGGFYDHVIPPIEYTVNDNFSSPLQGFGQRVPLLVISPYSREAYVDNTLMSHLSLDHFIEYNWRLSALTPEVGEANLPLGFFDFAQTPRAPLVLTTSGPDSMSTYPIPLQVPLTRSSSQTSQSTGGGSTGLSTGVVLTTTALVVAVVAVTAFVVTRPRNKPGTKAKTPSGKPDPK